MSGHTLAIIAIVAGMVGLLGCLAWYATTPRYTAERARPSARHAAPLTGRRKRRRRARATRAQLLP